MQKTVKGLNIQGSLEHLVNRLRKSEGRRIASSQGAGQYSMLFYGPPGTGKSELAKYLATELDKDLMLKRSNDLLDPYVGRTERHIAEMFAEAEAREAVLVLDEADTFFFGRDMAQRSWEISQVNEFLTRMESYQGILICTTNRFQGMDRASVRRFQEKIFFDYLEAGGIEVLFRKFLCPLCKERLEQDFLTRLTSIKGLTPGDFKNVRDMYTLQDKRPGLDELISALEEEVRLKDEQQGKKAGFRLG